MWNDRRGYNDDRAPKVEPPLGVFMVRLQNPQGSQGSQAAVCAYKYDVYLLDNQTMLSVSGTPVAVLSSPCRGFPMLVNTAATYGMAFYDSGDSNTLKIMTCNESTGNQSC